MDYFIQCNDALSSVRVPFAARRSHAACMTTNIRLFRHPISGHCHRVELLLSLLGLSFERVEVDLLSGEQRKPEFLSKNPLGQVPVLEHGDDTLADSNAILIYLALRYDADGKYWPRDPGAAAQVQRWLSIAAGELVQGPGTLRLSALFKLPIDRARAEQTSARLLKLLEASLAQRPFLASSKLTLADVALYAYTARAPEGGLSLETYPNVRAWLARVEALPGFVAMQSTPS